MIIPVFVDKTRYVQLAVDFKTEGWVKIQYQCFLGLSRRHGHPVRLHNSLNKFQRSIFVYALIQYFYWTDCNLQIIEIHGKKSRALMNLTDNYDYDYSD